MSRKFYVTTFCKFAHELRTGKPIGHECYIIHPDDLQAERDGATRIELRKLGRHPGLPEKTKVEKLSEAFELQDRERKRLANVEELTHVLIRGLVDASVLQIDMARTVMEIRCPRIEDVRNWQITLFEPWRAHGGWLAILDCTDADPRNWFIPLGGNCVGLVSDVLDATRAHVASGRGQIEHWCFQTQREAIDKREALMCNRA